MIAVLIQFELMIICRQPDRLTSSICSALPAGALFTRLQPLASVASCLETDDLLGSWPARIFGCSLSSFPVYSSSSASCEAIRLPLSNLRTCKEHRSCLLACLFSSLVFRVSPGRSARVRTSPEEPWTRPARVGPHRCDCRVSCVQQP